MSERPAHNPRFNFVEVGSESILYDNETHNVIYLDQPASVVWFLCDGVRDIPEIAKLIADAYPDQRTTIADDVKATIEDLAKKGALDLLS